MINCFILLYFCIHKTKLKNKRQKRNWPLDDRKSNSLGFSIIPIKEEKEQSEEKDEKKLEKDSTVAKMKKVVEPKSKIKVLEITIADAIRQVKETEMKEKRKAKDEQIRKLALEQKARKLEAAGQERVRIHT